MILQKKYQNLEKNKRIARHKISSRNGWFSIKKRLHGVGETFRVCEQFPFRLVFMRLVIDREI